MQKNLTLVNVGTDERPANIKDEENIEQAITEFVKSTELPIIPIVLGTPTIMNLFPPLTREDGKQIQFLHVRVGTDDRPAYDEDIARVDAKVKSIIQDSGVNVHVFTTHHAVSMDVFPPMMREEDGAS